MSEGSGGAPRTADRDLVITRELEAPRELVFDAWTQPEHLVRWWAPRGCTTPRCTVDLRRGGAFHYCMRLADGREIWGLGIYREIRRPSRIVYVDSFADEQGNTVPPSYYGMSDGHPAETVVTVDFTDSRGGTLVTLRQTVSETVPERDGTARGWSEMLERLGELLATLSAGS